MEKLNLEKLEQKLDAMERLLIGLLLEVDPSGRDPYWQEKRAELTKFSIEEIICRTP